MHTMSVWALVTSLLLPHGSTGPRADKGVQGCHSSRCPHPFSEQREELKRLDLAELYQGETVDPRGAERMRVVAQCRPGSKVLPRL